MICTNVKLLGPLPEAQWLCGTFHSSEPLTGPNGILFKFGLAQQPTPLFGTFQKGPSFAYI